MTLYRHYLWSLNLAPVLIAIIFILLSTFQAWPFWQQAFRSDHSTISWLSSAQLWSIALVTLLLVKDQRIPFILGSWFFISILLMAMDEQFQFHEQWKYSCDNSVNWCGPAWVKELPIISTGVLGSVSSYYLYHYCMVTFSKMTLVIAVLLGLVAIATDLGFAPNSLNIFEEGFEVLAEAFWLSCLFSLTTNHSNPC